MTREDNWIASTLEEKKNRLDEKRSTMCTVAELEVASEREKLYGQFHHDEDDETDDEDQNVPTPPPPPPPPPPLPSPSSSTLTPSVTTRKRKRP